MTYGVDLVVRVFLQFDYQFTLNQKQILDNASYEILGKLVIVDKDNFTNYYEKDYVFQEKTSSTRGAHGQYYSVNKDIVIDYDEYNKVATHFKSKYGVDAEGYLIVYLKFIMTWILCLSDSFVRDCFCSYSVVTRSYSGSFGFI